MDKEIDTIKNMKENGAFKKYIEYIVFPYYAVYGIQRSPFCFRTAVFRNQRPPIF